MYISLLLAIFATGSAVSVNRIWSVLENIISLTSATSTYIPEDALLDIAGLAEKYGYTLEEHLVFTEDGYVIKLHRILRDEHFGKNATVVFLMHGILESSDSWVIQGPERALAYILADKGFDVWMGNARGNKHALTHRTLNAKMPKFWEFTWEEIGLFDLPAMIDYALRVTEKVSLYYVGYSQGTTSAYVLLSMKPEYNKKIEMMFSLAPEAWMENVQSPLLRLFSPAYEILEYLLHNVNTYSPSLELFNRISAMLCSFITVRCDNFMYAITGYGNKMNESLIPVVFGHMPTGASTLQFLHYGQLVLSKRFCRYDYEPEINLAKYGRSVPPDYNLSNVTVPMVIYYSGNDWFSDPRDVDNLKNHLPNVYSYIYLGDFSHMDYVYSYEAVDAIYLKIIEQIEYFENINPVNSMELFN